MYKVLIIILCCALCPLTNCAQNTFSLVFHNPLNDYVLDIVELNNGGMVAVGGQNENDATPSTNRAKIWKIGPDNDTLSKLIAFGGDTASTFGSVELLPDGDLLIYGYLIYPPDYTKTGILVLKLNPAFEKVFQELLVYDDWQFSSVYGSYNIQLNGQRYLAAASWEWPTGALTQVNIFQLGPDLKPIKRHICTEFGLHGDTYINSCILSPDSSELWYIGALVPSEGMNLARFDTALNYKGYKKFPVYWDPQTLFYAAYSHLPCAKWVTDSTFLVGAVHTRYDVMNAWIDNDIGLSEMDSSLAWVPVSYIGSHDTTEYIAFTQGMDFRSADTVMFLGTYNQNTSSFFPTEPSWIMAGQTDRQLAPRYVRYYGGDAYYYTLKVISNTKGGMAIAAMRYDYLTQDHEYDVVFLKLNSEGLIVGNAPQTVCPESTFTISPNPCIGEFEIDLFISQADMRLLSLNGQELKAATLCKGRNTIPCHTLPPGVYLCQVTGPDHRVFTKKLIIQPQ